MAQTTEQAGTRGARTAKMQDAVQRAKQIVERISTAQANPQVVQQAVTELRAELDRLAEQAEEAEA